MAALRPPRGRTILACACCSLPSRRQRPPPSNAATAPAAPNDRPHVLLHADWTDSHSPPTTTTHPFPTKRTTPSGHCCSWANMGWLISTHPHHAAACVMPRFWVGGSVGGRALGNTAQPSESDGGLRFGASLAQVFDRSKAGVVARVVGCASIDLLIEVLRCAGARGVVHSSRDSSLTYAHHTRLHVRTRQGRGHQQQQQQHPRTNDGSEPHIHHTTIEQR